MSGIDPTRNCRAVVVGINKYQNFPSNMELKGAENDAKEIAEKLKEFGYFKIDLLLGSKGEATSENIRKAISNIFYNSQLYEIVLFYFAGHGILDASGNGYIAPSDMLPDEPFVYGINMQDLNGVISNYFKKYSPASQTTALIVLDCCYSGLTAQDTRTNNTVAKEDFEKSIKNSFGEGKFYLASSSGTQKSKEFCRNHRGQVENHDHGVFSYFFIEGLDGAAANDNGDITLARLISFIDREMTGLKIDQAFTYDANQARNIENIRIAMAHEKRLRKIERLLKTSEFDEDDLGSMYEAAVNIEELLLMEQQNKNAIEIKKNISEKLKQYKEQFPKWLLKNEKSYRKSINGIRKNLYISLYDFCANYLKDFDSFLKISEESLCLLGAICDASHLSYSEGFFPLRCQTCCSSRPESENKDIRSESSYLAADKAFVEERRNL